jgi:hypothetical protein
MPLGYSANQGNKRGKTIMVVRFTMDSEFASPRFTLAVRCGIFFFDLTLLINGP